MKSYLAWIDGMSELGFMKYVINAFENEYNSG